MLLFLLEFLKNQGIHIPNVFFYLSTRMILSALTALFFTLFLGPPLISKLRSMKWRQPIRKEAVETLYKLHEKKDKTPTMGGVLILGGMLLSLILWMDLTSSFTFLLMVTTLVLGGVGGFDDYLKLKHKNSKGLSGRKKMGVQLLLALFIGLYLFWPKFQSLFPLQPPYSSEVIGSIYFFPFFKEPFFVLSGAGLLIGPLLTLFIITGTSNAVNLSDGLDSMAAGLLVFASSVLAIFAFISSNSEIARYLNMIYIAGSGDIGVYLAALFGGCLGFLWFNSHPAEIFMGDVGSLPLGGILAVSAILLRREFLLALVGGVFVIEAFSVILQVLSFRLRRGKRIFLCTPLHHHFEYKGWPETKVVLRFWIIGLILAMLGLASVKFQ
ncbi:MAG: phospho-N-acetylmuramoyl-pentapeptide-transferase [Simkaniaceae bacterium]